MQCPNCGKEIPNDSIYCEFCGARMKKSRKALWIILSVVLAVVIAVVAFAIIQEQQEHQAVIAWEQQQAAQKQQELEQQLEAGRQAKKRREAELARQEAERQAKLEAERKAELARQEAERQAKLEAERKAELVRQEAARQAEIARQKEAERQAEIARQREARRQELLSQGLVDLGLPSGTLWKNANEGGDYTRYTYDEAVRKFGNKLPTKQQFGELINKCTWIWTGSGYKVIGPNGYSIYLPAAGYRRCYGEMYGVGTYGYYWSSTPYDSDGAWCLRFFSSEVNMYSYCRCHGQSVRLVQ